MGSYCILPRTEEDYSSGFLYMMHDAPPENYIYIYIYEFNDFSMLESVKAYIMTIKIHQKSLKMHENDEIVKFNCAVHKVCDPNFCCYSNIRMHE